MSRELHLKRLGFVWTYSEYYFNWVSGLHPMPPSASLLGHPWYGSDALHCTTPALRSLW